MFELAISLKKLSQNKYLFPVLQFYRRLKLHQWLLAGRPSPPPHMVKQLAILKIANKYGINILIETGTYLGDMIYALRENFIELHSIELDIELYKRAKDKFSSYDHIYIHQGDSGEILGNILSKINAPCIFWLDGHYSSGITAKGVLETPIKNELNHIIQHPFRAKHKILIDDARDFGSGDYPSIERLRRFSENAGYEKFIIKDDIIRVYNN